MVTHTKFTKVPTLIPLFLCCDVNADKVHLITDEFLCQSDEFKSQSDEFNSQWDEFICQRDEINCQKDEFNCQNLYDL